MSGAVSQVLLAHIKNNAEMMCKNAQCQRQVTHKIEFSMRGYRFHAKPIGFESTDQLAMPQLLSKLKYEQFVNLDLDLPPEDALLVSVWNLRSLKKELYKTQVLRISAAHVYFLLFVQWLFETHARRMYLPFMEGKENAQGVRVEQLFCPIGTGAATSFFA